MLGRLGEPFEQEGGARDRELVADHQPVVAVDERDVLAEQDGLLDAVAADGVAKGGVFGFGERREDAVLEQDLLFQLGESFRDPGRCPPKLLRELALPEAVADWLRDPDQDRLAPGGQSAKVEAP